MNIVSGDAFMTVHPVHRGIFSTHPVADTAKEETRRSPDRLAMSSMNLPTCIFVLAFVERITIHALSMLSQQSRQL